LNELLGLIIRKQACPAIGWLIYMHELDATVWEAASSEIAKVTGYTRMLNIAENGLSFNEN
jgi:hypothetical protein